METAATQRRPNQIGVARVGKADREKRYVRTYLPQYILYTSTDTSKLLSILQNVDQRF